MAGIFGAIIAESARYTLPRRVHVASGESSRHQRCYWHHQDKALLGSLHGAISQEDCFDASRGIGALIHGVPIDPDSGTPVTAVTLLKQYHQRGPGVLERLDGDFLVAILDRQRDALLVANDRMGTCPIHYHANESMLTFAPDAWLVCALSGLRPEFDEVGVLEFLSMGHAVDSRTLVDEVRQLEPAQLLEVKLSTAQLHCRTYWQLHFKPQQSIRESVAATDLYEALSMSVRAVAPALSGSAQLLLTGGYDSRALMNLMCQEGEVPQRALCWGVADDIPLSDVDIASRVAAFHGVPFRYLHYDHDTFTRHAERWIREVGLCSDNLGNFIAGPDFLDFPEGPRSAILNGDQLLGVGGIPASRHHAFEAASGLPFSGPVQGLAPYLRQATRTQAAEMAGAGVHRLVEPFWSESAKNVQDHLSYRLHLARWLNAPTFFREPLVSSLRPMLHQPVMTVFQTLPDWLRVDKRLLLTMLKQHLPETLQWPRASADSLVDWRLALTREGETAAMFHGLVRDDRLADSSLSQILDTDAIRAHLHDAVEQPPAPMSRRPAAASMITSVRRWGSRYRAGGLVISCAQRGINRARGKSVGADAWRVLQRIALISLLLRVMECPEGKGTDARPYLDLKRLPCRWHGNETR